IAGLHSFTRIPRQSAAHRNMFGRAIENMKRSIGICIVLAAGIAAAHEGSDPLEAWYRSLTTADGKSCCSMHDCAPAEARLKEGHWEVLIFPYNADDARWFPVPDRHSARQHSGGPSPVPYRGGNLGAGPQVRIRLPPAESQVRTCLSREFAFLGREAAVFRGCPAGTSELSRPRHAGAGISRRKAVISLSG